MDVLSEVLDTLQLRSTGAEALKVEGLYRAVSPKRQVLAHIVMSGNCTLEVDGGTGPLTLFPLDCFLMFGEQHYQVAPVSEGAPARLLRCSYSFEQDLHHPFAVSYTHLTLPTSDLV